MGVRILLDMDDTLVDFCGAYAQLWGLTTEQLLPHWPKGEWLMLAPLGAALGRDQPMSLGEFWLELEDNEEFWLGLQPLPWFDDLVGYVSGLTSDWAIATAPGPCPSSCSGKVKWLKRRFGADFKKYYVSEEKHIPAGPCTILVDDHDSNVASFRAHGGRAVVFPRHNNRMHHHADDPLGYVKGCLNYWLRQETPHVTPRSK